MIIAVGLNDCSVYTGISDEDGDTPAATRGARAKGTKTEGVAAKIRQICQGEPERMC